MVLDPALAELNAERSRLARLTRRGIGMPLAGLLFWLALALLLRTFPLRSALLFSFFATGAVFPVGALLTRLLRGDLFARSPSLTPLGILLAAVQLFYWPVLILVFRVAPPWTPYVMAVLFGSHFLPYAWFYRSRGYAILAGSTAVVVTVAVVLADGPLTLLVPWLAAACYAGAVALLWREARAEAPLASVTVPA